MKRGPRESGSLLAALGGIVLLISLFLDWYRLANFTVTAWTAFEVWDLVLVALALAAIVSAAAELGYWRGPTHSVGLLMLGLAALVIVASQLIDPPPSVLHSSVGNGGWLALAGAVLMVAGALMAESRVTLSFNAGAPGAGRGGWGRRPTRGPAGVPLAGPGPGARPADRARARPRYEGDPDYEDPAMPPAPRGAESRRPPPG